MKHLGRVRIAEGSTGIKNLVCPGGSSFPNQQTDPPNEFELFTLRDNPTFQDGLYQYLNGDWQHLYSTLSYVDKKRFFGRRTSNATSSSQTFAILAVQSAGMQNGFWFDTQQGWTNFNSAGTYMINLSMGVFQASGSNVGYEVKLQRQLAQGEVWEDIDGSIFKGSARIRNVIDESVDIDMPLSIQSNDKIRILVRTSTSGSVTFDASTFRLSITEL